MLYHRGVSLSPSLSGVRQNMAQQPRPFFQGRHEAGDRGDARGVPDALRARTGGCPGKAAAEASEIFSQCPVCGRLVCDRCFLICEDLDLCTACAEALQVRGDVVAGETSSPREFPAESTGRITTEGDETT